MSARAFQAHFNLCYRIYWPVTLVLYRDQCAYKKDGGNTEDTYCFKTEGATHTTECVETGQQSGYHHKLWSVSLKNLEEINLFHILCLLRVSQHPIRRIRQLPLQQGQSEFCGVPDQDRHAGRLLSTIWHCHHIRRGHHHSNIYVILRLCTVVCQGVKYLFSFSLYPF